jgi:cell filamentation protein
MSDRYSNHNDPYSNPKTGVLWNKLSIETAEELRKAEYFNAGMRSVELSKSPINGVFDLKHLQAIHKHQFQDVYEWAGKLRTIDISKDGDRFASNEFLESGMRDIHRKLEKNNFLKGLEKSEFVDKFTDVYGDINALHPFREGNGRSTRLFMGQLAEQAGYKFDRTVIDKDERSKHEWNKASKASFHVRMEPLRSILNDAIQPIQQGKSLAEGKQAPRHDLNKNQAQMHVAATERSAANLAALKQNPALAKHPPEALEKLAYWRGIAQEAVKQAPPAAQDVALAKFDKAAEDPALLARLEKSDTQEQAKSDSKTRERDDYGLER